MKGIQFNYTNIFMFASAIMPFLIVFFMIMLSIFDYNIKGFVYVFGLMLCYIVSIPLQNVMNVKLIKDPNSMQNVKTETELYESMDMNPQSPLCYLFNFQENALYDGLLSVPSFNSSILAFTFIYIVIPMLENNTVNFAFIFSMILFIIMDSYARVKNYCTNPIGVIFGLILGVVIGTIYYVIIKGTGNDVLLYNTDFISNKVACSRPSKQQFKCAVYKNGELLRNIN